MNCNNCGSNNLIKHENKGAKFLVCDNCGYIIQTQQSDEYDKFCEEQQKIREQTNNVPTIICPYCQSIDTKKITNTSKAIHTALFGILSMSRNAKEWHCNNCDSDF